MLDCKKNLLNCTSNVNFCVQYYQEKREILDNNFNSFDNLETSIRKSSVIQERINLVSTHMYKSVFGIPALYNERYRNFCKNTDNMQSTVEYLKQSFGARGVATDNIFFETDETNTVLVLHILWHTISFTTRWNNQPQASVQRQLKCL